MDIHDLIPYVLTFGFAVMVVAVIALVLNGFQSSSSTTIQGANAGGSGAEGQYEQANYIVQGTVTLSGQTGNTGGGGGGGGFLFAAYNAFYGYVTGTTNLGGGSGDANGGAGQNVLFNTNGLVLPVPVTTSGAACANNLLIGQCGGSVTYTTNVVLTGNINVSTDLTINAGQTLTTQGYSLVAGNMINNKGTILTGFTGNGGAAGIQAGGNGNGSTKSNGGSGAGGLGCVYAGGNGGAANQIAAASGGAAQGSGACVAGSAGSTATPNAVASNALIRTWLNAPEVYMDGSGGGGQSGTVTTAYNAIGNGLTATSNIASQFGLLGTVIGLGLVLGIVLAIFGFGKKNNETL